MQNVDPAFEAWMDSLEINFVNYELQLEADRVREEEIAEEWMDMMLSRFTCSEFESSHVEDF